MNEPAARAAALLHAILDDPDNDALRQVYADLLCELGDPRGEFIALQYRRRSGHMEATARQRERQLLATCGRLWLGPLAPFLARTGLRFSRGFLVACRVRGALPAALIANPLWATVEDLEGPDELVLAPTSRALRRVTLSPQGLRQLLAAGVHRRWTTLRVVDGPALSGLFAAAQEAAQTAKLQRGDLQALLECGALLPQLGTLELEGQHGYGLMHVAPSALDGLLGHADFAGLQCLAFAVGLGEAGAWVGKLARYGALRCVTIKPLPIAVSDSERWELTFERAGGALTQLTARLRAHTDGPVTLRPLIELLDGLDPRPTRLVLRAVARPTSATLRSLQQWLATRGPADVSMPAAWR